MRRVFRIGGVERDLDEELAHHFDATVAELTGRGWPEQAARDEAARRFGDADRWRRRMRKIDRSVEARRRRADRLQTMGENVRFALRSMARSPGFTAGVVLTFALGIGANATMFGILDRTLLSPPAHIEEPDAVVRLGLEMRDGRRGGERHLRQWLPYPDVADFQKAESLAGVAGFTTIDVTLGKGEVAREARATLAGHELFPLLGVEARIGRFFGAEEDRAGGTPVALISHELWQGEFGGGTDVLGKTLDFGEGPWTIIGVAPKGFTGVDLDRVDVWLPLRSAQEAMSASTRWETNRNFWWMRAVGRVAPGVSVERVTAELTALHRAARAEMIAAGDHDSAVSVATVPLLEARGPEAPPETVVAKWLAGVSLLVLLIACANVANLLLARAVRQRREIGVRLALGISRGRLLGQLLTESLVLSLAGAAAALLVTRWGSALVRAVLLPERMYWPDEGVGGRVALFAAGLSLVAGLIAGLVPAVQASSPDINEVLKSSTRTSTGHHHRTRNALTVVQAALSVLLLVGAGLFVRSLDRVEAIDMGFDADPVMVVAPVYDGDVPPEEQARIMAAAADRLRRVPGVEAVGASSSLPFWRFFGVGLEVPGLDSIPRAEAGSPLIHPVDPSYFRAMGLSILRGRTFTERDATGGDRVALVNETMARLLWPGRDALGRCMIIAPPGERAIEEARARGEPPPARPPCAEVIGIVENARSGDIVEGASMHYYVPLAQKIVADPAAFLLVRVAGEPEERTAALRKAFLGGEPALRYADMRTFRSIIDPGARSWKLGATMFSVFGILALVVAGIGLYSLLAFSVAQRTREFGIRSALGSPAARLLGLVVSQGVRLVALGAALGAATAFVVAPRLADMLYETSPRDPAVFGTVIATLLAVAMAASAFPAWRAMRVDPQEALRAE